MSGGDSVATYSQFIVSTSRFVAENYRWIRDKYDFPRDTIKDLEECYDRTNTADVIIVVFLSILWTFLRFITGKYIFRPFAEFCGLRKSDVKKLPESAWKFLFYLSSFSGTVYIVFYQKCCPYFDNLPSVWSNYSMTADIITPEIRIIYLVEMSFYIHSLYATIYLDEWRKDSFVLIVHHTITTALLILSYVTNAHRVGILVLLLHDGCDVIMESCKSLICFKSRGGITAKMIDILSTIGFVLFIISWFLFRLYWFPLKAIYSCSEYFYNNTLKFPFMLVLYSMLWIILIMNIYWCFFILKLLVSTIMGKEISDLREYSESQTLDHKKVKSNSNNVNGVKSKAKKFN